MIAATIRTVFGFLLACFAGAMTQVLFVITPADLYALPADERGQQIGFAGLIALSAATQAALFAAPFALVAILLGRLFDFRGWAFYVFAGLLIALAGFLAIYISETGQGPTIANSYAIAAFAFSGIIAGYVFWVIARPRDSGAGPSYRGSEPRTSEPDEDAPPSRPHLKAGDYAAASHEDRRASASAGRGRYSASAFGVAGRPATTH